MADLMVTQKAVLRVDSMVVQSADMRANSSVVCLVECWADLSAGKKELVSG